MIPTLLSNNDKLDNTVVAAIQLVKTLNIEIAASEISRKLKWNPFYPSINSIQSLFKQWNVDTIVMAVDKENLDKLPPVFLCHLHNEKDSFKIVTKHDTDSVQWLTKDNEKVSVPISEFLEKWSGIVLIADAQESSGMPDYKRIQRAEWWEKYAMPTVMLLLFVAACANIFTKSNTGGATSLAIILLQLFSITGIFICAALLRFMIDDTDDAVKKLCKAGKKPTDCTKLINATDARIFGISWTEIGLLWFISAALCLATNGATIALAFFSIAAILFVPYSLYYQLRVARQWCSICLYILCIIVIQAGLYLYLFTTHFSSASLTTIFNDLPATFCCMVIPAVCWLAIKRSVFNQQALLLAEQGYFRLKHNQKVYDLLQTNSSVADTSKGAPVLFNAASDNNFEITIVSSLSCVPCGEAHKLVERVIKSNPQICFKMYVLPVMDPVYNTIEHLKVLLTILEREGTEAFLKALHYWYHIAKRDCTKFLQQYPERNYPAAIDEKIYEMGTWISQYEIKATPSYFINGKEMPEIYGIEDILAMVSNL